MLNMLFPSIRDVKVADILDILLIALFIYLILAWLKKSKARFMFIGMIAMTLLYVIARFAGLYMTTMALQAFFAIALIVIVVIFQDDFRHFFERIAVIGTTRKERAKTTYDENADILSAALAELSRKKVGALVVVRGFDPLDRHIETGVTIDAVLNQMLLESIFDRHIPMHDGAVVIDEQRISMFGCHLPLSSNIKEVGRLGTRHAAGLGLSERTDALCLIVSEEAGTISAAREGRIKHLKDASELQRMAKEFYNEKFPSKKGAGFINFLTRNFYMRALAVILSLCLWLAFSHRMVTIRRDFAVPIEYRNLAQNVVIEEPKPRDIIVTLSGLEQEFDIRKLRDLKVSIDAANIKDGSNVIPVIKEMVNAPLGFAVVNVDPKKVEIDTYRLLPVAIPVEVKTSGRPQAGVVIKGVRAEPKEVSATISSMVDAKSVSIRTEPVDLGKITETAVLSPKLNISPAIHFPEGKIPDIKVIIEVEKEVVKEENPAQEGKAR